MKGTNERARRMYPHGGRAEEGIKPRPELSEGAALEALHQRHPYQATRMVARVQSFFRKYGRPETLKKLLHTGLANSVEIIEQIDRLARQEQTIRDRKISPEAQRMYGGNSPALDRASERAHALDMRERLDRAIVEGRADYVRAYGPINEAELAIEQKALRGESAIDDMLKEHGNGEGGEKWASKR